MKKKRELKIPYKEFYEAREEMCGKCVDYPTCPKTPTCFSLLLTKLGFEFEEGKL